MDEAFIADWQTELGGGWLSSFFGKTTLIFAAGTCDVLRDKPQQARVHPHICHIYEGHHFGGLAQTAAWPDWLVG